MSEFGPAIQKTLAAEGGYVDRSATTGEVVNMGLTCEFLRGIGFLGNPPASGPCTEGEKQVIKSLSVVIAMQLYDKYIWEPRLCGKINDQTVAAKFFDLSVNEGSAKIAGRWVPEATVVLQRAINDARASSQDAPLVVDGIIGPATIAAANACDPAILMASIRSEGAAVYFEIDIANPQDDQFLHDWLARLNS